MCTQKKLNFHSQFIIPPVPFKNQKKINDYFRRPPSKELSMTTLNSKLSSKSKRGVLAKGGTGKKIVKKGPKKLQIEQELRGTHDIREYLVEK